MDLSRFIKAHEISYKDALREIRNGRKETHWMWYIFPQITGLGMSETAKYYEIKSLEEARDYLSNEVLGSHLIQITSELLNLSESNPEEVFGYVDALKLNSCMTLFSYVSDEDVFSKVIKKFYNNKMDENTIRICKELEGKHE